MQATESQCPFCHIDPQRIVQENPHGFVVRDGFPVSEGHSLIIPKRHVGSFFDLKVEEQQALLELLNQTKQSLCYPDSVLRHSDSVLRHSDFDLRHSDSFPCHPDSSPCHPEEQSDEGSHSNIGDRTLSNVEVQNQEPSRSAEIQHTEPVEVRCPELVEGFNIGINDGPAAGQTVPHCHIHLIPRYKGDVDDPRGGVRWVLPAKADYWSDKQGCVG